VRSRPASGPGQTPRFIELFASPEVGTYIGGPRPRDELERAVPGVPGRRPGLFVIDLDGAMIGMITLDRRDAERPGHVRPDAGEAELERAGVEDLVAAQLGVVRVAVGEGSVSQ
jgi:hypothetical protein